MFSDESRSWQAPPVAAPPPTTPVPSLSLRAITGPAMGRSPDCESGEVPDEPTLRRGPTCAGPTPRSWHFMHLRPLPGIRFGLSISRAPVRRTFERGSGHRRDRSEAPPATTRRYDDAVHGDREGGQALRGGHPPGQADPHRDGQV